MIVEYKATIRPAFALDNEPVLTINVNGFGKDDKSCRQDAQRQVRSFIKALRYDLELRSKPA